MTEATLLAPPPNPGPLALLFTAAINTLPIDGFAINGFGVTGFRTFSVVPLDNNQLSAVANLGAPDAADDDCCTGVMVPPAKAPLRTPWGTRRW